ncbi:NAD(P)/FAD-dependent oxidoreductase [Pseudemcibacter aquimaris]|uniref:NAD(P)/FAD-dependent oxidoreductase n=1 Tax=Pseudemcibacter aquimaris TaxID=2857064 RepID=UPI00201389D4|nr:FAD-binding oxidoreductase [Pseudemcibacter aquimaris]MCC3861858.1 FAD-binding oxidoreductase [Pseudemcibacter aquimaris]WDU58611.1 FAD-binding oxidoreductase [Pseudemcibacter aquimaris]
MDKPYAHAGEKYEYIDSYYSRTLDDKGGFPQLEGDVTTSVCVIGGGMAGVATASSLVEKGEKPVLIEANRIGWGASGRNGGFVSSGYSKGAGDIVKMVGKSHARELYKLTNDALDTINRRMGDQADNLKANNYGHFEVSWFNEPGVVENYVEFINDLMDVNYEYWPKEKFRDYYKSNHYHDAYLKPQALQLHSLNYTRHSARVAENGGAGIYEKSPAVDIKKTENGWKVTTEKGSVTADRIVMCCSAYIGNLNFRLSNATLPVATYVLLTEPLGDRLKSAIEGRWGVSDNRFSSNYYRTFEDTSLFWGGRVSMFNPQGKKLEKIMMDDLLVVYPQLKGIKANVAWGGFMGYPVHKMPQIGELEPGFWYAQGFGGSGMTATVAGGEVVADAIVNGDERYKLFEPFGLDYAGKPFGPIVAQTAYWLFQLRDAYKEWRLNR